MISRAFNGTFLNGQRIDGSATRWRFYCASLLDGELSFFHLPAPTTAGSMATQVISGSGRSNRRSRSARLEVIRTFARCKRCAHTIRLFPLHRRTCRPKIVGQEAIDQTFQGLRLQNIDHPLAAVQESRLLRRLYQLHRLLALEQAPAAPESDWLFLHLHIAELNLDLSKQLTPLLSGRGPHNLVAQMPVADLFQLPDYADHLAQLEEMQFSTAYEGFLGGVQQLQAIESHPPTFLKLAPAMVRGIDRNRPRQTQLKALVAAVSALGSQVIGTGFHSQNEVKVCLDLGCALGQGDLFG
ncbi:MAG: EAL domain-containing protein [Pirellulales bacterium]